MYPLLQAYNCHDKIQGLRDCKFKYYMDLLHDDDDDTHDMLSTHHECDSNCLCAFLLVLGLGYSTIYNDNRLRLADLTPNNNA